jgi:hypothetical protein
MSRSFHHWNLVLVPYSWKKRKKHKPPEQTHENELDFQMLDLSNSDIDIVTTGPVSDTNIGFCEDVMYPIS